VDVLSFVSSVIQAIAWPAAVFGVGYILRGEIRKLIGSLNSLTWKGAKAEFAQKLEEAEAAGENLPEEATPSSATDRFKELAIISPRAAVTETWRDVESAIDRYLLSQHFDLEPPRKPGWLDLRKAGLPSTVRATIDDLRVLRNSVAHGEDASLTADEALAYRTLADRVVAALTDLTPDADE
jgi:hypothetical protein